MGSCSFNYSGLLGVEANWWLYLVGGGLPLML